VGIVLQRRQSWVETFMNIEESMILRIQTLCDELRSLVYSYAGSIEEEMRLLRGANGRQLEIELSPQNPTNR